MIKSFADELLKLASLQDFHEDATDNIVPPNPQEASSRLPNLGAVAPLIRAGLLGEISQAKHSIDQVRHNRGWRPSES